MTEEARKWHHLFFGGLGDSDAPALIETYHEPSYYRTDVLNPIPGVGQFHYIKSYDEKPAEAQVKKDFEAWKKARDAGE